MASETAHSIMQGFGSCCNHKVYPYDEDVGTVITSVNNLWLRNWQDDQFPRVDDKTDWNIFHMANKYQPNFISHHSVLIVNNNYNSVSFYIDLVKTPIDEPIEGMTNYTKVTMRAKKPNPDILRKLSHKHKQAL